MKNILKKLYNLNDGTKYLLAFIYMVSLFYITYLLDITQYSLILLIVGTVFLRILFLVFIKDEVMESENMSQEDVTKEVKLNIFYIVLGLSLHYIVVTYINPRV